MCAILDGRSIDTTMGFSPQSGLENATRHGDFDLFALLYLMQRKLRPKPLDPAAAQAAEAAFGESVR